MKQEYLECGRVTTTHGVKGAVKIEPWCDSPRVLASLSTVYLRTADGAYSPKKLKNPSVSGDRVIAYIGDVSSLDDALLLRGKTLYASRAELSLEPGKVFIADLIGLPVIDNLNGTKYGVVADVVNRGASDIYVVKTPGGERMMPAVEEFVKRIDLEEGIFVETIPGLLSDD